MAEAAAEPPALTQERLVDFHRWSLFLPRRACIEAEQRALSVKRRLKSNPGFFDKIRDELTAMLDDCKLLSASGLDAGGVDGALQVYQALLEAQRVVVGLMGSREFHKALALGQVCLQLAEALAHGRELRHETFWIMLCHLNIGVAYMQFQRSEQAAESLKCALKLVEQSSRRRAGLVEDPADLEKDCPEEAAEESREWVLAAACYAHLGRMERDGGDRQEARYLSDFEVDILHKHMWRLPDTQDSAEAKATVVASAQVERAAFEAKLLHYQVALKWLSEAQICMRELPAGELGPDAEHVAAAIQERSDDVKVLLR